MDLLNEQSNMLIQKIKNNIMYPTKKFWNLWKVIRWVTYSKGDLLDTYEEWCLTLLRANNINDGINFDELQYLPKWFVEWDKILKNGDIIFCMSSGSRSLVWKNTIVPKLENHSFGAFCSSFRLTSDEDINYIGYYLKSETYKKYIYSLSQWVNILNLRGSDLENLEIPLPPLSTQSRIVARLDSTFASIDEQISLLRANIVDVENMRTSALGEIFHTPEMEIFNKKMWDFVEFTWWSQPPKEEFVYEETLWYVRLIQIRDYKSDKHIVYVSKRSVTKFCTKDDIMVWRYWPPIFQILRWIDGAYNVALMKAKFDKENISPNYLYWFLNNPKIQEYIISLSQRAAWQTWVNKTALEAYPIPLPPLPRQQEIVAYLDRVFVETETLRGEYEVQIRDLEILKQSLLEEAFAGRLVKEE